MRILVKIVCANTLYEWLMLVRAAARGGASGVLSCRMAALGSGEVYSITVQGVGR